MDTLPSGLPENPRVGKLASLKNLYAWLDWENVIRRTFDVVTAAALILLTLPLMVIIAMLIRLDSDGPVLFVSARLGRNGKLFPLLKFRSMYVDAEQRLAEYLSSNPEAREEWRQYQKLRGYDPRVTRVGRWIRRTSLDELPQLFNVLLGHMSLVGPRPYLPRELPLLGSEAQTILSVKPGITGLWQVSGRNNLTFEQRVQVESYYVKHRSILLDLYVLAKTPFVVLLAKGAH